ncbi:MAG: homocysteine S-methyltransferase family protein [Fimbriimonadaceae bacterium]|nr:homocysteine S-methyltransferase family protein [Fimbriimonadaceae bacterium]
MTSALLEALYDRVLVYDGAMGTQIQGATLDAADFTLRARPEFSDRVNAAAQRLNGALLDGCNELLVLNRPELIESIHARYLEAGSDLIETNSFGTTSIVLAEYDIPELVFDLAKASAQVARRAADRFSTSAKPRFVIGALGPGTKLISLGQTTWAELESTYTEGFVGLLEGGADGLLLETLQDLLMVKAGVVAAERAMAETGRQVPLFVQVTMEQTGTMLLGSEIGAALNMLEMFPIVKSVGINCATGPLEMSPHVRFLGQHSTRPIAIQPNAGLPQMEQGRAVYKLSPAELAEFHDRFVSEHGVALCGGCCGTTPDHLRAVADAVGGRPHGERAYWQRTSRTGRGHHFGTPSLVGCSSLYQFQPYEQDNTYLIVGEKTNANGSKAFREMLAAENWEGLTELARELEGEGSHVLDVCTAYVGRDEVRDMTEVLRRYNQHITVPLMIDSTEVPVMEAALQRVAGKPILNSINFEDGERRARQVLELARKYGAAVVALTIDERGMAKTVEDKVAIAERLLALTAEYGLADHDVFIDCLTFTLGSGDEEFRKSAIATIDAIAELRRRHSAVNTVLGVSNVSFGLKPAARQVLNSVFLHYAREAGLTTAIVHGSKIQPESRIDAEHWRIATDLVFDRREFAAV